MAPKNRKILWKSRVEKAHPVGHEQDMLNSKQKAALKALAHPLKPVVQVGKKGITENLERELEQALLAHELIKVKFNDSAADERESTLMPLALAVSAELVDMVGHTAILYRAHPEKPKIKLPK
jgi:RNA-binding protein